MKDPIRTALAELVDALDNAFISSWQSTGAWQKQMDAARAALAAPPAAPAEPAALSDEQIGRAHEAAYKKLVAEGYNGGMGGETWDLAAARAVIAADRKLRGQT